MGVRSKRPQYETPPCYSNEIESATLKYVHMITGLPTKRISALSQWQTFLRVSPTRWRQKSAGIDMEQNYVTATLCILKRCFAVTAFYRGRFVSGRFVLFWGRYVRRGGVLSDGRDAERRAGRTCRDHPRRRAITELIASLGAWPGRGRAVRAIVTHRDVVITAADISATTIPRALRRRLTLLRTKNSGAAARRAADRFVRPLPPPRSHDVFIDRWTTHARSRDVARCPYNILFTLDTYTVCVRDASCLFALDLIYVSYFLRGA